MLFELKKRGPAWLGGGLVGFTLGIAISAATIDAMGLSALTSPNKVHTDAIDQKTAPFISIPQPIILSVVKDDEIEVAINDFSAKSQPKVREDVRLGRYQLLWLTAWDWDTAAGEPPNTILISTGPYRQIVKLNSRRKRIAIRQPRSDYIEMRGLFTADGNINISLLSGTQAIALPTISAEQAIRIKITVQQGDESLASISTPTNIPSLPE